MKVSQSRSPAPPPGSTMRRMGFTILVRVDDEGARPVLLESGQAPEGDPESNWRFVASIDNRAVADQVVEMLRARCEAGTLPADSHARDEGP